MGTKTQRATDNFDRADANPIGAPWTTITGQQALQIVSNAVKGTNASARNGAYHSQALTDDQYVAAKYSTGTDKGLALRVQTGAQTMYRIYIASNGTTAVISKLVAGTNTDLGILAGQSFAADDIIEGRVYGSGADTVVECYQNGGLLFSANGDATVPDSGYAGISGWATSWTFDDWEAGDYDAAGGGGGFVSLSDAIVYSIFSGEAFLRYLSDPMGLTDSIQGRMTAGRNVADPLGMADTVSRASAFTRFLSDMSGMTDANSVAKSLARLLSDAMGASDSTIRAAGAVRRFADAMGIADSLLARKVLSRALSDSVGVSDAVSRAMAYAAFLSDPMGIADSDGHSSAHARVSSDAVGIEDALSAARGLFRTLSESMGVEDALVAVVSAGGETFIRLISDTMTLTDPSMDAGEALVRFIAETVGITDESVIQAAYARYLAADMGVEDSAVRSMGHARIQTDTVGMTDAIYSVAFLLIYRTAADTVGIADSSARYHSVVRFLSDALGVEDEVDRASVHARIMTELAGVTDTTERAVAVVRQVSEALGLTDADIASLVSVGITYTRIITDALGITDAKYQASAVATWLMIVLSLRRMVFLEAAGPFVALDAFSPGLVQAEAAEAFTTIDVAGAFVTIKAYKL